MDEPKDDMMMMMAAAAASGTTTIDNTTTMEGQEVQWIEETTTTTTTTPDTHHVAQANNNTPWFQSVFRRRSRSSNSRNKGHTSHKHGTAPPAASRVVLLPPSAPTTTTTTRATSNHVVTETTRFQSESPPPMHPPPMHPPPPPPTTSTPTRHETANDQPPFLGRGGILNDDATLSTLGFDNTFQDNDDEIRPIGSLTSLNEVLDGPLSPLSMDKQEEEDAQPQPQDHPRKGRFGSLFARTKSSQKAAAEDRVVAVAAAVAGHDHKKGTQPKHGKRVALSNAAKPESKSPKKQQQQQQQQQREIQYFTAVVVQDNHVDTHDEIGNCEYDDDDEASIQAERNVGAVLKTAMEKDQTGKMKPWVGVLGAPMSSAMSPNHPTFVTAPPLDARVMTAESWDSLADGQSLDDVLHMSSQPHHDDDDDDDDKNDDQIGGGNNDGTGNAQHVPSETPAKPTRRKIKSRIFGGKKKRRGANKSSVSDVQVLLPLSFGKNCVLDDPVEDDDGSIVVNFRNADDSSIVSDPKHPIESQVAVVKSAPALTCTEDSSTTDNNFDCIVDKMSQEPSAMSSSLRLVTSADGNEQPTIRNAEFAPVEVGADEHVDHAKTTILNREAVAQRIHHEPRRSSTQQEQQQEEDVVKRSMSLVQDNHLAQFVEASPSFMEQLDRERSDLSDEKESGEMRRSSSGKKLLFGRRRKRSKRKT